MLKHGAIVPGVTPDTERRLTKRASTPQQVRQLDNDATKRAAGKVEQQLRR